MSFEKWNHHKTQVPSHNATHTKRIEFYLMVVKHAKYAKYVTNTIISVYGFKTIQIISINPRKHRYHILCLQY